MTRPNPKPGDQTMRIERLFDATPQELWMAWTQPAQLAKWISPFPGIDAEVHEMDAREGGHVRFTMIDDKGMRYPEETLLFEELTPHTRIVQYQDNADRKDVFAGHPMRITITLEPVGKRTKLTLVQTGLPPEFPIDMAKGGFSACLDKLASHLAGHAKTLKLERVFDASPIDLWGAWTDPKQYAKWFNPAPGIDLVIHEFDVKVGGKIRFDMPQPDGNKNPQEGVFHMLTPFSRIVSGAPDKTFVLDVRFEPQGKRTLMRVEVTGVPPEYHAMATQGWNAGFDKLTRLLETTPRRTKTLRIERTIPASPERVYGAWTEAATLAKWFSPIPGVDATVPRLDARVGGRGEINVQPPQGEAFGFFLHYLALAPGREIVLKCTPTPDDADQPAATIRFAPAGTGTRMTFESPDIPEVVYEDAAGGWNAMLDRLATTVVQPPLTNRAERTFDATPAQVWAAWTDPQQIAKWLAPWPGVDADVREADVRVGGKFRFSMASPEGETFPEETWRYTAVRPQHELTLDLGNGLSMTATIEAVGKRTRLVVTQRGIPNAEMRELFAAGLRGSLDKMVEVVAKSVR